MVCWNPAMEENKQNSKALEETVMEISKQNKEEEICKEKIETDENLAELSSNNSCDCTVENALTGGGGELQASQTGNVSSSVLLLESDLQADFSASSHLLSDHHQLIHASRMRDSSIGAVVPAMKKPEEETTITSVTTTTNGDIDAQAEVADKELLCPICMQMIKDAFLTACGHSFCYMCIVTHLRNKSDCPCCFNSLTPDQLFPNFLLDKLLKKTSALQLSKNASPVEQFRQSLEQL